MYGRFLSGVNKYFFYVPLFKLYFSIATFSAQLFFFFNLKTDKIIILDILELLRSLGKSWII